MKHYTTELAEMIIRLKKRDAKRKAWQISNRETDAYYERELIKFDEGIEYERR